MSARPLRVLLLATFVLLICALLFWFGELGLSAESPAQAQRTHCASRARAA